MTSMRPIERGTFTDVLAPENLGPAPQLQWISIENLVVDDAYQRPLESKNSRANVRAIAAKFDWRQFAPVIVSPIAGGRFAIVDGQHRTTAALLVGIKEVPCSVVLADQSQQARAFQAINGQVTKITGGQLFKARLAHGDPAAVRIYEVARSAGVRILTYTPSTQNMRSNETLALASISRVIEAHGDLTATVALKCIVANAGDATGYLRGPIVIALATVLADHTEWRDAPGLSEIVNRVDLDECWRDATRRAALQRGTTSQDQLQALLITHFDKSFPRRVAA